MRYILSTIALTALASSCVTALGINCRGSFYCKTFASEYENVADQLSKNIQNIPDDRWYENGEHIECIKGYKGFSICAFLQGTNGLSGKEIKTLAKRIVEHGCKGCGSVPVYFDQQENDVNLHGQLTFNFFL